jgi:hypothetical protein
MQVVLLSFGGSDIYCIRNYCKNIMDFFCAWADSSDYVEDASRMKGVGLRKSMTALGITERISRNPKKLHNAGNDTVRNLAVLAALYTRDPELKRPF